MNSALSHLNRQCRISKEAFGVRIYFVFFKRTDLIKKKKKHLMCCRNLSMEQMCQDCFVCYITNSKCLSSVQDMKTQCKRSRIVRDALTLASKSIKIFSETEN